ncbi:MocR-like pyridoxine biosynthesis transcription factor PdxR [Aneurinibacillus migulanus]|uniref:GntR family transcriptional regulator n=1 Tax=Aneurinibacillus migulanus TaxID=47500 RepID=A0A0D1VBA8_ANEMI|nr:PLP-dependent aminotransferase family protein [Aneurinibacillus migulanus]KIV56709.1 GntR family transcriptional regulator [Aneurinibacillus migulanus]KON97129.1 GntR family transcriptional regulator [Aneurinibacillus migulanus]MED0895627.1 PLP-dependent aminotransferase family protein [Aneurinibacillus migulanus]MED1618644.1 PLP-dependent aminotransferase family protein [Aneurinibacillus migulanus]SDK02415.1 transcriptional regulator, GntR family [Aneurinibacillus migulanus]
MKNTIFTFKDDSPKYKQIYEQFKLFIEQGDILANEQLPSIRQLADSLQVSRNTTLMAYDQLVAEGYIRGEGRKGYFANKLEPLLFQEALTSHNIKRTESRKPVLIDFRAGAVDQTHFPLKIWRRIANQVLTLQESFRYGEPFGEMCLREQIATYLLQSRGVKTDANAIIIGSSTQQMLIHLGHILKDDFSSITVEDPGYDGAREAFQLNCFTLETLPVYETGADFSQLEHMKSRLIYVAPSHHSPYGVSMPIQQRHALIHWADKRHGYIIEDDYDSEFRYTQQPFPALASIDASRVIYLGNFSKSFLPGIRLSYMVLPQPLLDRYKHQFLHFESTTSILSQLTMAKFMENGEWNRHIKRMRLVYKRKMQHLVSVLRKEFEQNISIIGEQSGLYLLVKVHLKRSEEWLIERASSYGVKVYPTSLYFVKNNSDKPIIKLGFSNLSCDQIQLGVELLKKAWS